MDTTKMQPLSEGRKTIEMDDGKTLNIRIRKGLSVLSVFFNEKLHFSVYMPNVDMIDASYFEEGNLPVYQIDFLMMSGAKKTLLYRKRNKWEAMLDIFQIISLHMEMRVNLNSTL